MTRTAYRPSTSGAVLLALVVASGWWASPGAQSATAETTCTEVIGFSQTQEWYEDGGFEQLVDAQAWQLRWQGGAFITKWADPDFEGWQPDRLFHDCAAGPADRVVLTISATGQDVQDVVDQIRLALATVEDKHPGAAIVLQPLVGGPDGETCTVDGHTVRASRTAPMIAEAVAEIVAEDAEYIAGPNPTVASCDQYTDSVGHISDEGAVHVAEQLAEAYGGGGGGGGGGDPGDDVTLSRWWGQTRYDTATAVAQATFADATSLVHVATGRDFPDALAAGAIGAVLDSPVLLTEPDSLPPVTGDEVERLGATTVVVPGGTEAVSDDVLAVLEDLVEGEVRRHAGQDRYDTAASLARSVRGRPSVVFVASGESFPDALAGGPLVAARDARLLLTRPDELPAPTRSVLETWRPDQVVVLGGPDAVSIAVQVEIEALAGEVTRVSGADRYETAVAISRALYPDVGGGHVFLTTGQDFPDAVAAAPAAHRLGAPVLLVEHGALPDVVAEELTRLKPTEIVVVGGDAAVSDAVADAALAAARRAS